MKSILLTISCFFEVSFTSLKQINKAKMSKWISWYTSRSTEKIRKMSSYHYKILEQYYRQTNGFRIIYWYKIQ